MIRFFQIVVLVFWIVFAFGQDKNSDYWRNLGFKAKVEGDLVTATKNYLKILEMDSSDYDARLAVGRLYMMQGKYKTAIHYFNLIYKNDSTDVEAMNGLGKCFMYMDENKQAIEYFRMALQYLPNEAQQYFYLAKAYSYDGKLDEAISTYRKVNKIDSTYSETWAGIGKMYYWKGKPKTAKFYYNKALLLDPENVEIQNEFKNVQNELKFGLTLKVMPVNEIEETYEINALTLSIKLDKRINDHFYVEANVLVDHSNRVFVDNIGDTTRWYNSSWVKGAWISEHNKISAYAGYSFSDDLFSTYGINWKLNYKVGKFAIKNSITAGYDYFYYWNHVGAKSISNTLDLGYGRLNFSVFYATGIVDPVLVSDLVSETYEPIENPFNAYSFSLSGKIVNRPAISLGLAYSFLDYKYKSPLYYTPFNRKLTGAFMSIYYKLNRFYVYGRFAYNIGTELNYEEATNGNGNGNPNSGNPAFHEVKIDVDNWSANVELGYQLHPFTISVGGSKFYNPFYQSLNGFVNLKFIF